MNTLAHKLKETHNRPTTEFEVQADCYQYLKTIYPLVRGEIKVQFDKINHHRRERGARFDLVIYSGDNQPQFIIEVKRKDTMDSPKTAYYEQLSGVPCYTVGSLQSCKTLIEEKLACSIKR